MKLRSTAFLLASVGAVSTAFAAPVLTVNPANAIMQVNEGTNGNVVFTFTNTGAASRIGGAGTVVFAQMGPDLTDFVNFGALNFDGCDPFLNGGNNVLGMGGMCTLTTPFTTDVADPAGVPLDNGTRVIRSGLLLANGQMAFGQVTVSVVDPPAPPPNQAALMILPDFASVVEGAGGTLAFTVTNTGTGSATIGQLVTDATFMFGDPTDDAGIGGTNGCASGTVLAPGGSCIVNIPFFTPLTPGPAEDFDFGVTSVGLNVTLVGGLSQTGIGGVLVDDVVPEPNAASLVLIGMLGMTCWRWHCRRR